MASDTSTNSPATSVTDIAGLILSAGASSRMGMPKALLKYNDGSTLLSNQVKLMKEGGISKVGVVIGADSNTILDAHPELDVRWIENHKWKNGQFSSIQSGLKILSKLTKTGVILLPVDVVGVKLEVIRTIIEAALVNKHLQVIAPEFEKRGGHPIYLSNHFCNHIVSVDLTSKDARLDMQIRKTNGTMRLPLNDPAIIRNINTPEEWRKVLDTAK